MFSNVKESYPSFNNNRNCNIINCVGVLNGIRKRCEEIYDGILLWPESNAGELIFLPCPKEIDDNFGDEFHAEQRYATRYCMEDGNWYWHPTLKKPWSNYTSCWNFFDNVTGSVDLKNKENILANAEFYETWLPIIKSISMIGYSLSLCFLVLSLIIFITIKKLYCPRNVLHMHLFLSFLMRATMHLLKENVFVSGIALASSLVKDDNATYIKQHLDWRCKFLVAARFYFILANHIFILMEGIYLINLMFFTIFSSNRHVIVYCLLGWGLPSILIGIWVFLKITYNDILCWTLADTYYNILIKSPIAISIIINFIIFIVMLRVLCGKINSMNIREKRTKYRKLSRSTLTLVLLLGTPHVLSEIVSYNTNRELEITWIFLDQTFTSFQGLIVAFTYCLLNSEVQSEIKQRYKSFYRKKRQSRSRTISHTQQYSIPLQDDNFDYQNAIVYWHKDRTEFKEITFGP